MAIQVLGAGFGRTGTLSLKHALETIGLGPCYHMLEVIRHPSHPAQWISAADGEEMDWDALFEGYASTVDWPGCTFWRPLLDRYPDAKVLLTVRDGERWYRSVAETIYPIMHSEKVETHPILAEQMRMVRRIVAEDAFGGRFEDRAHAISVFERHNEEVQRVVPAERLLVFQVADGWEPLCAFLGRPVPDQPFPHLNSTEEFNTRTAPLQEDGDHS